MSPTIFGHIYQRPTGVDLKTRFRKKKKKINASTSNTPSVTPRDRPNHFSRNFSQEFFRDSCRHFLKKNYPSHLFWGFQECIQKFLQCFSFHYSKKDSTILHLFSDLENFLSNFHKSCLFFNDSYRG